jgi:hypothetical protein
MPTREDFAWFKDTFHAAVEPAIAGTPFTLDLLTAIAAQETGHIWSRLRTTLALDDLLAICVGDTLDADKGRSAFPKTRQELVAAARGDEMFTIGHDALVAMAAHVPGFAGAARNRNKFCHGYGIFQYDLQFFKTDPAYFLERKWVEFGASLGKCLEELRHAMQRMGIGGQLTLSELEQVHVAIAYNAGSFKPAKGLKQGFFDGQRFYGELIFEFLRMAETVPTATTPARIPAPPPGRAPISPPSAMAADGQVMEVDVEQSALRLRSEPKIPAENGEANVIARLPDGHRVRLVSGDPSEKFLEVETSLNGAHFQGFAATRFLLPVIGPADVPVMTPDLAEPVTGVVAVFAPRKSGGITKRAAPAGPLSLNEPNQPGRAGTTPSDLREELAAIIDYLAVDKPAHLRYLPQGGRTFCTVYAHDYCFLAGVYLPRVWWTPDAIERLAEGETVKPRVDSTVDEQRADDLFRWFRAFGPRFGWRQTGTLTKLQTEVNAGAIGVIVAVRKTDGEPGHAAMVVPEIEDNRARRDRDGEVIAPVQSQAGSRNFRYGTGTPNWWKDERFSDYAFWIHP